MVGSGRGQCAFGRFRSGRGGAHEGTPGRIAVASCVGVFSDGYGLGIIGISLIQGAIQAGTQAAANAAQRSGNGNTSLNFNSFGQGGQSAADELLRSWVEIPDIITRDQGTTCGIYVVRDLDMHGAYQLTQRYRP